MLVIVLAIFCTNLQLPVFEALTYTLHVSVFRVFFKLPVHFTCCLLPAGHCGLGCFSISVVMSEFCCPHPCPHWGVAPPLFHPKNNLRRRKWNSSKVSVLVLHTPLAFIFIYCSCKSIIAMLTTLHIQKLYVSLHIMLKILKIKFRTIYISYNSQFIAQSAVLGTFAKLQKVN
jgi:hypothetical protein